MTNLFNSTHQSGNIDPFSSKISEYDIPKSPPTPQLHFDYFSGVPIREQILTQSALKRIDQRMQEQEGRQINEDIHMERDVVKDEDLEYENIQEENYVQERNYDKISERYDESALKSKELIHKLDRTKILHTEQQPQIFTTQFDEEIQRRAMELKQKYLSPKYERPQPQIPLNVQPPSYLPVYQDLLNSTRISPRQYLQRPASVATIHQQPKIYPQPFVQPTLKSYVVPQYTKAIFSPILKKPISNYTAMNASIISQSHTVISKPHNVISQPGFIQTPWDLHQIEQKQQKKREIAQQKKQLQMNKIEKLEMEQRNMVKWLKDQERENEIVEIIQAKSKRESIRKDLTKSIEILDISSKSSEESDKSQSS